MVSNNEINVRRYDKVVKAFSEDPKASHELVSKRTGVPLSTVEKIWDGTIARPPIVLLDRLRSPRRCPECGTLCSAWPCIVCELERRAQARTASGVSFVYRGGPR